MIILLNPANPVLFAIVLILFLADHGAAAGRNDPGSWLLDNRATRAWAPCSFLPSYVSLVPAKEECGGPKKPDVPELPVANRVGAPLPWNSPSWSPNRASVVFHVAERSDVLKKGFREEKQFSQGLKTGGYLSALSTHLGAQKFNHSFFPGIGLFFDLLGSSHDERDAVKTTFIGNKHDVGFPNELLRGI